MKKKKGQSFDHDQSKSISVEEAIVNETHNAPEVENLVLDAPRAMVSHDLLEQFERFYEYHPARRLSRNLRSLLLEFLMYDGSAEAEYLRDLVIDLDGLFSLLDAMEEEAEKPAAA
ncbi:MAG TPA: hypothetical protein VF473_01985 [Cyclobacteriaceae bacterium]